MEIGHLLVNNLPYLQWNSYGVDIKFIGSNGAFRSQRKDISSPPLAQQPSVDQDLLNIEGSRSHSDTPHSAGLSGRVIGPSQKTLPVNIQHSQQTDIQTFGGKRTHNPSNRAAADPSLRPRRHCVTYIGSGWHWALVLMCADEDDKGQSRLEDESNTWFDMTHFLTLILPRSRTGMVWFYTSTSNKRAARPKLYTKSLTKDLKRMYSRFTLVRISINL